MFKVNNKDAISVVLVSLFVNFEHISHLVLVFLLLTLNMQLPAGKDIRTKLIDIFLMYLLLTVITLNILTHFNTVMYFIQKHQSFNLLRKLHNWFLYRLKQLVATGSRISLLTSLIKKYLLRGKKNILILL